MPLGPVRSSPPPAVSGSALPSPCGTAIAYEAWGFSSPLPPALAVVRSSEARSWGTFERSSNGGGGGPTRQSFRLNTSACSPHERRPTCGAAPGCRHRPRIRASAGSSGLRSLRTPMHSTERFSEPIAPYRKDAAGARFTPVEIRLQRGHKIVNPNHRPALPKRGVAPSFRPVRAPLFGAGQGCSCSSVG
jgi:hypothetical protein